MKKLSVREAVLNYIKKHPASATTSTVVENLNKPVNQIHTAVWKLVKAGTLTKDSSGILRLPGAPSMTALKPNVPIAVDSIGPITKRKATGLEMSMGKRITALEAEIDSLKRELTQMSVNYYDALAVIKYLENKAKG